VRKVASAEQATTYAAMATIRRDERLLALGAAKGDGCSFSRHGGLLRCLTFEFTRGQQTAKPAVERRVQRRVRQHGLMHCRASVTSK
jgi:hypothetical protein